MDDSIKEFNIPDASLPVSETIIEQINSLNEQGWNIKKSDTKRALEVTMQARQLSAVHGYLPGTAYSLRNSSRCYYLMGDYKAGLTDALEATILFEKLDDKAGLASAFNCLGGIYDSLGEHLKSLESHSVSLQIAEENNINYEASGALHNLGRVYFHLGDYAKALEYWHRSLQLKTELGDRDIQSTLCNIGVIHEKLEEYPRAADFYLKAMHISRETQDTESESICLMNLGMAHRLMKNHAQALEYLLQAVEVAQKNEHRHAQAAAFVYLGKLYQDTGIDEKALDSYREGLATAQQIGLRIFESEALIELGQLFGERKDYRQAVESLTKALGIAQEMGNSEQTFKIHHLLSQSYEQDGDYARALDHYKAFYASRQKVFGEESDKNLKRVMIQAEVATAQREAEIQRLKHVELAARVRELEEALAQIKQLQSLLPICSYCKSIRDDQNYWQSVESYIGQNTGTQFSHSICPPCYDKVVQPQLDEMRRRKSGEKS